MTYFSEVYSKFLSTIKSYTLANLSPNEIEEELFDLLVMSIPEFKYPYISLDYAIDQDEQYYFINTLSIKESRVLLAIMRKNWASSMLTQEQNFDSVYYDSTTRTHSRANMINQLNKLVIQLTDEAKEIESDYYRVSSGAPSIGEINA